MLALLAHSSDTDSDAGKKFWTIIDTLEWHLLKLFIVERRRRKKRRKKSSKHSSNREDKSLSVY